MKICECDRVGDEFGLFDYDSSSEVLYTRLLVETKADAVTPGKCDTNGIRGEMDKGNRFLKCQKDEPEVQQQVSSCGGLLCASGLYILQLWHAGR
jgi:hypothetical protein